MFTEPSSKYIGDLRLFLKGTQAEEKYAGMFFEPCHEIGRDSPQPSSEAPSQPGTPTSPITKIPR